MYIKPLFSLLILLGHACNNNTASSVVNNKPVENAHTLLGDNDNPYTHINKIPLPNGYKRVILDSNSFERFLCGISLKKDKTVYKYDHNIKENQNAQFAVLDISLGNKNLQQCADAVMRLRAEYLYAQSKFDKIIFADNEGGKYQFTKPYNREHFAKYLDMVFGMCGSASLSKQLKPKLIADMKIGDVLIRGGFPGHAVIVVDMAINKQGNKIYLLAQSYMPAQDIHILLNPSNSKVSPWYELNNNEIIKTPEYWFKNSELKEW